MKNLTISFIAIAVLFVFSSCNNVVEQEAVELDKAAKIEKPETDKRQIESSYDIIEDTGTQPEVFDIEDLTLRNANYRMATWTGEYMQLVFMSLKPGEEIMLEVHNNHDQFIRIEQGSAIVKMGDTKDNLYFKEKVYDDWAIMIPGGYWHQIINAGDVDLKLYTIYAPPEHPKGTVNKTYEDAVEYEKHHHHH